jgi:hypothetical protein
MAMRTIISLLRRNIAAKQSMEVDLNRHCVGTTTLRYGRTSVTTDRIPRLDLETSKKIMMDQCATSVIISWPVSKYGGNTKEIISPREVSKMEEYLRQSCNHEVTTSRPFFVLDGGGQRLASLSLIGH